MDNWRKKILEAEYINTLCKRIGTETDEDRRRLEEIDLELKQLKEQEQTLRDIGVHIW